jgi:Ca2+-binding EF-hand superfamily protein
VRTSAVILKPVGTLEDAGISADDSALGAVTKLYNYINTADMSAAEMMKAVDQDGDGELDVSELAEALQRSGIGLPSDELKSMLSHIDLSSASTATGLLEIFSKIEQIGSIGSAMADRALARVCTHLNKHNTTAGAMFAKIDADGSGELDISEFQPGLHDNSRGPGGPMGPPCTPYRIPGTPSGLTRTLHRKPSWDPLILVPGTFGSA